MAALNRPCFSTTLLRWPLLFVLSSLILFARPSIAVPLHTPTVLLEPIVKNVSGTIQVFDPDTDQRVPQGAATDGGGNGFDAPAILWIMFCCAIGAPMSAAGIRGWRLTTGIATGLSLALCSWAALINTVNQIGISDILLTTIIMAFFFLGFILGVWEFARVGAITCLALVAGLAFGIRVVLLRDDGLLLSDPKLFALNWAIAGIFAAIAVVSLILHQRKTILLSCSSVGTFFLLLAFDLVKSKQDGISRGLRLLFDHNDNHFVDITTHGYHPQLVTRIAIAVSLGLIPIFAVIQHKIFADPFNRRPPEPAPLSSVYIGSEKDFNTFAARFSKYRSNLGFGQNNASRFSV